MNIKRYLPVFIVLGLVVLAYAIHRDILLDREGTCDLRNRIVGARLQKDGIAPYFYKWQPTDSLRYYDPNNVSYENISNITASPFFHTLLYPIADLPQRQISYLWLILEYVILFIAAFLAFLLCSNNSQRILVIATAILFLLTEAWRINAGCGQLYIVIPFLAMLFYYCISKPANLLSAFLAGIFAVSLILIRPNAIVFFIPFLFLLKNYSRRFIVVTVSSGILLAGFYFSNKNNRLFWSDYKKDLTESIRIHQKSDILVASPIPPPTIINEWEGWNMEQIKKDSIANNFKYHSEHGNVFVTYYHIFKKRIPLPVLNTLSAISVILVTAFFFLSNRKNRSPNLSLANAAIVGSCLYMLTDFFSPVWRHQYNTVPWLFPLLIAATIYKSSYKWLYIVLGIGLLLNIVNPEWMKMEHTIGEYVFMAAFLILSLTRNLKTAE